jgi:formylglycine-generating enzyme required for sulfatase activity
MAKIALLVGVSEYQEGLNPLPSAVKDIEAIQRVLQNPEIGGFDEVRVLSNPEPMAMQEAVEDLFSSRSKDDLVLLFFSGHGVKDDRGRLYFATRETRKNPRGELVKATAVPASFVQDIMSNVRCKRQVLILDCCYSGAFAEGMTAKDDGIVDIQNQLGGEGRAVLTSSTSTQYSFEEKGSDLSVYTQYLVEGMESGDADSDGDGSISIDELHEYASQKVRELHPAMKPEIYAIREGFKIRLAKVAPGDPSQQYRKEVARFIHRGEISFVGRRTLDVLRNRLGLEATQAKEIEDEVLGPYRKEFREKLQQYEHVFTDLLKRNETITEGDRHDLQNLQQILGLRNEDTMPIEAQITAQFKTHQQSLQAYEQSFSDALRQEYRLSEETRLRLRQMQQQLKLTDGDIAPIEAKIIAEVEAYRQKLQQYEQVFATATRQEYPLSEAKRNELRQQQQELGLTDVDVASIVAKITTQIETYNQKLQQYEQAFVKATQRKHYPDEVTRSQLQKTWQTLGLSDIDVEMIESRLKAEIDTYQANLQQYELEFKEAVQKEYPLNESQRSKLTQRYLSLNLTAEDVNAIENPIFAVIEEHRQKLQQYEQVFGESIQFGYPVSDATRDDLCRFQQILELENEEVLQVEARVIAQQETTPRGEDLQIEKEANLEEIKSPEQIDPPQVQSQHRIEDKSPIANESSSQTEQAVGPETTSPRWLSGMSRRQALILSASGIGAVGMGIWALSRNELQAPTNLPSDQPTSLLSGQQTNLLSGQLKTPSGVAPELVSASSATKPSGKLQSVEFKVVTVDAKGQIVKTENRQAGISKKNLGKDIVLDMVSIPSGSFQMGSPPTEVQRDEDESPQHQVTVPAFWMGRYAVTQEQWKVVASWAKVKNDLNSDPSSFKGANRPVESITWDDAVEFCARLSKRLGREYRLPSEAEWEYACRGGTKTPFHFGETITTDLANYDGSDTYGQGPKGAYRKQTTEVGSFKVANAYGLYDMHGNVWEWCQDHWDTYKGAPADGSAWVTGGAEQVLRGGSWNVNPWDCRSANRNGFSSYDWYDFIGLRVVCVSAGT